MKQDWWAEGSELRWRRNVVVDSDHRPRSDPAPDGHLRLPGPLPGRPLPAADHAGAAAHSPAGEGASEGVEGGARARESGARERDAEARARRRPARSTAGGAGTRPADRGRAAGGHKPRSPNRDPPGAPG